MESIAALAAVWSACGLLLASAVCDLRRRRIPNSIPLALLGLFAVQFLFGACAAAAALWAHLAVGAVMLAAGYAVYLTGRFGAGDGKLLSMSGLWIGPVDLSLFMFGMAAGRLCLVRISPAPIRDNEAHAFRASVRRFHRVAGRDRAASARAGMRDPVGGRTAGPAWPGRQDPRLRTYFG